MNYVQVSSYEAYGHPGIGIKILVAHDRPLTDDETFEIGRHAEKIRDLILEKTFAMDPEKIEQAAQERQEILGLFDAPIYVEEFPNGYCPSYCCKHLPWFVVTTPKGRIKIGWRKRVISIDWSDTRIAETAAEMFPAEDVTKEGRLIHAWGLEKARQYVKVLLFVAPCWMPAR